MLDPVWPEELPGPQIGWTLTKQDNVLRFEPERGPAKTRRLRTAEVMKISSTLVYDSKQMDRFLAWLHGDIADGALAFDYHDFVTDQTLKARITDWSSEQEDNGNSYEISINMEIFP